MTNPRDYDPFPHAPKPTQRASEKLWYWQYSRTDCFSDLLFDLIAKADPDNRRKLRSAFPDEVATYERWCLSPTPDAFFREHAPDLHGERRCP